MFFEILRNVIYLLNQLQDGVACGQKFLNTISSNCLLQRTRLPNNEQNNELHSRLKKKKKLYDKNKILFA